MSDRNLADAYLIFESDITKQENKVLHDRIFAKTGILMMMTADGHLP